MSYQCYEEKAGDDGGHDKNEDDTKDRGHS